LKLAETAAKPRGAGFRRVTDATDMRANAQKLLCRSDRRDAYNLNQRGTTKTVGNRAAAMPLFFASVYPFLLQIEALNLAAPQKLCARCDPTRRERGHMNRGTKSRGTKTILAHGAVASFVALAALATSTAGNADERPLFISIGDTARAPIGWVEFCIEYEPECKAKATQPRDVMLNTQAWKDLERVNLFVNTHVKPMTDMEHWGVVERWNYPDDGYGDCEDYVLQKRRLLIQAGWPREALLITVVRDKRGDGHAILTVKTDKGEFVLDNQNDQILLWSDTGYRFVKRQSQTDQNVWVSLGEPRGTPATATSR
jgi:predicted transglutaminase-like cysteine proteinase